MDIRNIVGHQQGAQVSISNVAAQTGALEGGVYEIYVTCNARIKIDPSDASGVTALTGALALGGNSFFDQVPQGGKIGVIAESALLTGTMEYHWVRP